MDVDALRERFERDEIAPGDFGHRQHVAAAWAMLGAYPFLEATRRYAETIRRLAERRDAAGEADWSAFIAANSDLLERDILGRWYSPERLTSPLARRQFVLPDRASSA